MYETRAKPHPRSSSATSAPCCRGQATAGSPPHGESFASNWPHAFAGVAGPQLDSSLPNQLPIYVIAFEWKPIAEYCRRTGTTLLVESPRKRVMGTVDECVEQLQKHIATGVDRLIFVPYRYQDEQLEIIAREIIPRLKQS